MSEPGPHSAGLLVKVFPIGRPGTVGLMVYNTGPEMMTRDEAARTLRAAADFLKEGKLQVGPCPPVVCVHCGRVHLPPTAYDHDGDVLCGGCGHKRDRIVSGPEVGFRGPAFDEPI